MLPGIEQSPGPGILAFSTDAPAFLTGVGSGIHPILAAFDAFQAGLLDGVSGTARGEERWENEGGCEDEAGDGLHVARKGYAEPLAAR